MVAVTNAANRRSRTGRLAVDVEAINGLPMAGPGIENLDGFSGKGRTMTLVVLTVIVIGLVVAALAIYLFKVGVPLNRTADNLGDCLQSVRTIVGQAQVIGPGVTRINKTGAELLGAMPLLIEGAGAVAGKPAPSTATASTPAPAAAHGGNSRAQSGASTAEDNQTGRGYLDAAATTGVGYLDV